MPIHLGKDKKGNFVQWGHRTKYYYTANNKESLKRAKAKCQKQVGAIFANGYVGEEISNNIPQVLYHATYKPLLRKIKLLGLGNTKHTYWEDSVPGVIYLSDDPDVAESYADTNENVNEDWIDEIIILKINTSNLDLTKLFVDNNIKLDDDEINVTWEYHDIIPWENIEIYQQNNYQNNKFNLLFESVMTNTISNINELKQFYKTCRYSLVDWKENKCWKDTHMSTILEDWSKDWKLLSPTQVIQYNCGICYDTAKMSDYYLTKWNIEHKNFFACSERNYNDYDFNDPTHTFTIYLDKKNNKWKWLEGSWEDFKNNTFKSEDPIELTNWILKALANDNKLTYIAAEFKKFPKNGVSLSEFGKWSTTLTYNYRQLPDGNLQKYALDEIKNILNNPGIGYGYYNADKDEIIDDNDENNPLPDSAFNNYKLQSFEDIITYKLGVCWDCTSVIDKLLTLAGIKHLNLFLYGGGDQYTTHTTTIYTLDDKTWNWCDGSWHIFGSDDKQANLSSNNKLILINNINKLHEKTFKQTNDVYLIINYPKVGSTSKQFINNILKNGIKIELKND